MGGQMGSRRGEPRHLTLVALVEPTRDVELGLCEGFRRSHADEMEADLPGASLQVGGQSRNDSTAMNASCGIST